MGCLPADRDGVVKVAALAWDLLPRPPWRSPVIRYKTDKKKKDSKAKHKATGVREQRGGETVLRPVKTVRRPTPMLRASLSLDPISKSEVALSTEKFAEIF